MEATQIYHFKLNNTDIKMNGLVFRMFNALLVIGYYSPDEYWQSLEIAHKAVWYGEATWEWDS